MRRNITYPLLTAAMLLLLAACASEQSLTPDGPVILGITADISPQQTRSNEPSMATAFGNGETIGVTALNGDQSVNASNRPFTSYGTGNTQKWRVPDNQGIPLSENSLTAMAYYPYTEGVDPAAIPVTCTNDADFTATTDWMYGQGANVVNTTKPFTPIAMYHAQTGIRISLSREAASGKPAYSGTGKINSTTLTSDGFRTSGTMNTLVTPAAFTFDNTDANTFTVNYNAGNEPQIAAAGSATDLYYYVLTTGTSSAIGIRMTIDGAEYAISTSALTLQMGHVYHFHFVLTDQLLIMQSITITPWGSPVTISEVSQLSLEETGFTSSIPGIDMNVTDSNGRKVLFAPYNIGTTAATEIGNLYQWASQTPVTGVTASEALSQSETYRDAYAATALNSLKIDISGNPQYDPVVGLTEDNEDWMGWRLPTYDEYKQLANTNRYSYVLFNGTLNTSYPEYGTAKGILIIRKADTSKRLFIPMRDDMDISVLWTSTPTSDEVAGFAYCWYLYGENGMAHVVKDAGGNTMGCHVPLPVRAVRTVE